MARTKQTARMTTGGRVPRSWLERKLEGENTTEQRGFKKLRDDLPANEVRQHELAKKGTSVETAIEIDDDDSVTFVKTVLKPEPLKRNNQKEATEDGSGHFDEPPTKKPKVVDGVDALVDV